MNFLYYYPTHRLSENADWKVPITALGHLILDGMIICGQEKVQREEFTSYKVTSYCHPGIRICTDCKNKRREMEGPPLSNRQIEDLEKLKKWNEAVKAKG